ncbi:chitotriosidase-1-like isoform X2 [Mya arenaria]|uniref:chitotriosidase-1-like isoform X2 n=1 Tax=Mya arenaria TaxID=6604 RepID=UPI0022E8190C|nr:chitotriosidase-1-like isoform X2 [Mya arenaria]
MLLTVTLLFAAFIHGASGFRIVCVYTNWSQYRPGDGKFLPEDVDPTLCTHLIYVYAKLQRNKLHSSEWNDEGTRWKDGMYQRVINLKELNPEMKVLLGVGGWMMGSKDFSRLASRRGSRRVFARSAVKFLRDRKFDGLTIDWQHPTRRGGRPRDRENYSFLLKEVRMAFDAESKKSGLPPLLLTAGVSASIDVIDTAYEVDNLTRYTDFLNVFAYDLHGAWDNYTGHPSQLYPRQDEFGPATEINVDASMRHWMSLVPDASKLVLGVSTYGRTFTLRRSRHHEYNVPTTGPGVEGEFTRQTGMLAYYERCNQYMDAPRVWDPVSQVAYWYSGDQWIAGEDTDSVRAKVNWARYNAAGGIMLSSLDMDDFTGMFCTGEISPLLNAIHDQLKKPLPPNPHYFEGFLTSQQHTWEVSGTSTVNYFDLHDFTTSTEMTASSTTPPTFTSKPTHIQPSKLSPLQPITSKSQGRFSRPQQISSHGKESRVGVSRNHLKETSLLQIETIQTTGTGGSSKLSSHISLDESAKNSNVSNNVSRLLQNTADLPTHSFIDSILKLMDGKTDNDVQGVRSKFNTHLRLKDFDRFKSPPVETSPTDYIITPGFDSHNMKLPGPKLTPAPRKDRNRDFSPWISNEPQSENGKGSKIGARLSSFNIISPFNTNSAAQRSSNGGSRTRSRSLSAPSPSSPDAKPRTGFVNVANPRSTVK